MTGLIHLQAMQSLYSKLHRQTVLKLLAVGWAQEISRQPYTLKCNYFLKNWALQIADNVYVEKDA